MYDISYKTSTCPKTLCIKFGKIERFIIILDCTIKHLILFDYGLFNKICEKIKYLIFQNSGITKSINHNQLTSDVSGGSQSDLH